MDGSQDAERLRRYQDDMSGSARERARTSVIPPTSSERRHMWALLAPNRPPSMHGSPPPPPPSPQSRGMWTLSTPREPRSMRGSPPSSSQVTTTLSGAAPPFQPGAELSNGSRTGTSARPRGRPSAPWGSARGRLQGTHNWLAPPSHTPHHHDNPFNPQPNSPAAASLESHLQPHSFPHTHDNYHQTVQHPHVIMRPTQAPTAAQQDDILSRDGGSQRQRRQPFSGLRNSSYAGAEIASSPAQFRAEHTDEHTTIGRTVPSRRFFADLEPLEEHNMQRFRADWAQRGLGQAESGTRFRQEPTGEAFTHPSAPTAGTLPRSRENGTSWNRHVRRQEPLVDSLGIVHPPPDFTGLFDLGPPGSRNFPTQHDLEIMMERERNIQALSAPFRPTFPRNNEEHCIVCFDETQPTIRLGCAHHYCQSCLKDMVKSSLSAAGTFPPKCCLMALPVTSLESHLGKELVQGYLAKKMEMETENRTYCSNKTCSAFIPPSSYSQSSQFAVVECPECSQWTCVRCKQQNHDGDCPPGLTAAEDQAVVDMALKSGWQRCYRCRSMIELTDGCVELQCTCGATFCYRCGKKWRTCSCPRFRGAAYPNEHVDDEIAARVEQLLLRTTNANRNMQASMQDRPERSGIATAELARERRRGEQQRVQDEIDLNFLLQRQQARQREFAAAEAARARQREFTAAAAAHFRRGTQRRRHRAPLESLFDRIENLEGTAHPGLGAFDHTQAGALEARQNHVRPTRSDHHRSDSPPANREMPVALRDRIRRARIMELSRGNTVLENRLHQQSETTPNIPATAQTGPTAGQETTTPLHPFPERRNEPERCRHNGQFILADIADERPACTRCRATTYPDRQVWVCVECAGIMCGQCHLWRLHDEITGHAGWLA